MLSADRRARPGLVGFRLRVQLAQGIRWFQVVGSRLRLQVGEGSRSRRRPGLAQGVGPVVLGSGWARYLGLIGPQVILFRGSWVQGLVGTRPPALRNAPEPLLIQATSGAGVPPLRVRVSLTPGTGRIEAGSGRAHSGHRWRSFRGPVVLLPGRGRVRSGVESCSLRVTVALVPGSGRVHPVYGSRSFRGSGRFHSGCGPCPLGAG